MDERKPMSIDSLHRMADRISAANDTEVYVAADPSTIDAVMRALELEGISATADILPPGADTEIVFRGVRFVGKSAVEATLKRHDIYKKHSVPRPVH